MSDDFDYPEENLDCPCCGGSGHKDDVNDKTQALIDALEWYAERAEAITRDDKGPDYQLAVHAELALDGGQRAHKAIKGGNLCQHKWVDARNKIIQSGVWCPKCNAIKEG